VTCDNYLNIQLRAVVCRYNDQSVCLDCGRMDCVEIA